jgi:hypothetical protein
MSWVEITTGSQPTNGWTSVASSITGQYCVAGNSTGDIWVSNDYGQSWTLSKAASGGNTIIGVAISQDGTVMTACDVAPLPAGNNVYLYQSGAWTTITTAGGNPDPTDPTIVWSSIALAVDKKTLAVVGGPNPPIWIYTIATTTWVQITDSFGNFISSNAYGYVTIAFNNSPYLIYSDDGIGGYTASTPVVNLATISNLNFTEGWTSITSNLAGTQIAICASDNGHIYVGTLSNNYWTFVEQTAPGAGNWNRIQFGPEAVSLIVCSGNNGGTPGTIWIGTYTGRQYNWSQQRDANNQLLLGDWASISRNQDADVYTKFIAVTESFTPNEDNGLYIYTSLQTANQAISSFFPCFLEDTLILTHRGYVPIHTLKKGDLVRTLKHYFVPVHTIGKKEIHHSAIKGRIKNQLYTCSSKNYAEVFQDLVITGCHSILVDKFVSAEQKEKAKEINGGKLCMTDNKFRLPACVDERTSVYDIPGVYTIYHIALENEDYYMNYGIFANGLLVETCSQRYLRELSNMTLLEEEGMNCQ